MPKKAPFVDLVTSVLIVESMTHEGPLVSRTFLDPKTMRSYVVPEGDFPENDYRVEFLLKAKKQHLLEVRAVAEDVFSYVRGRIPGFKNPTLRHIVENTGHYSIDLRVSGSEHITVISRGFDPMAEKPPISGSLIEISCNYLHGIDVFAAYALDRLNVRRVKVERKIDEAKDNPIKVWYVKKQENGKKHQNSWV